MTSLWKMPVTQISKLKAGSFVEAGTGIPLNSESPSHGLTFHPPGTVAVGAGSSASGHWHGACAAHSGWQSRTVRDYGQGLGNRGQLLDWPGQGPVPGPWCITAARWRMQAAWWLVWPRLFGPGARAIVEGWTPSGHTRLLPASEGGNRSGLGLWKRTKVFTEAD